MERPGATPRLPDALEDYAAIHMASRNMAQRTRVEYRRDLTDLIQFLDGDCHLSHPASVERSHL